MLTQFFLAVFLAGFSAAASPVPLAGRATSVGAVAAIEAIIPTSDSCDGGLEECRTAMQAAPFLIKAFADFQFSEMAAMLALIGYESGNMKYKHNVFPGVAGQGTSNMMNPTFVADYAVDVLGASAVAGKSPADVLALVTLDEYNFGSAPWFLAKKCDPSVRTALQTSGDAGWSAYMGCVGVDSSDAARLAYWNRAKAAFNLA